MIRVTDRARQELADWASEEQPDVYVRLMVIMEGG
jgi:Fe-S cluster assembly iron-binding protein IscA